MRVLHGVGAVIRPSGLGACLAILVALGVGGAGCSPGSPTPHAAPVETSQPGAAVTSTLQLPRDCPAADGVGSVPPAASIYSVTFVVNGRQEVVFDGQALRAEPGDQVLVSNVTICAPAANSGAGQACVDIAPQDEGGDAIRSQAWGSHLLALEEGFITVPGPSSVWTIDEAWQGFTAVLNHWPQGLTSDGGCADRKCERDDYMVIPLG